MTSDWQLLGYVPRDMTDIIHTGSVPALSTSAIAKTMTSYTDAYINLNLKLRNKTT